MTGLAGAQCVVIDTETTGTSVHDDRIVTAHAAIMRGGGTVYERSWLIAPDIEIPQAAIDVHGVDNERAQKEGAPPAEAIAEIANAVRFAVHAGLVVVAYNAVFDLSILNAECVRNGLGSLAEFCDHDIAPVVCPLVLDKAVDRYRRGKRKLTDTCALFGVHLDNAHDAGADARAAGALFHAMGARATLDAEALRALYADRRFPNELVRAWQSLGRMDLAALHAAQIRWCAEQAKSYAQHLRKQANEARHRAEVAAEDAQRAAATVAEATEEAAAAEASEERVQAETAQAVAEQEAAELDARVDAMCGDWPLKPFTPGATP